MVCFEKGKVTPAARDEALSRLAFTTSLAEACAEADLLIYDAMYTDDEYEGVTGPSKKGWGHSTWQSAVRVADRSETKKLVLFHHEPTRDDAGMEQLLKRVRKQRPEAIAARESQVISL